MLELTKIKLDGTVLEIVDADCRERAGTLEADIEKTNSEVVGVTQDVKTLDEQVGQNKDDIASVNGRVDATNENVSNIDERVGTLESSVGTIVTDLGDIPTRVGLLEEEESANDNAISTLEGVVEGKQDTVSGTEPIVISDNVISHNVSGATAGTYGMSANTSLGNGTVVDIPCVTIDNKGHVTGVSNKKLTGVNTTYSTTTSITNGSGALVTSGAVYTGLAGKQNTLSSSEKNMGTNVYFSQYGKTCVCSCVSYVPAGSYKLPVAPRRAFYIIGIANPSGAVFIFVNADGSFTLSAPTVIGFTYICA